MMKENLKFVSYTLFFLFFLLICIYYANKYDEKMFDINSNKGISYAIIKDVQQTSYKSGGSLYCEVHIEDIIVNSKYNYGSTIGCEKQLLNIYLPVFYSKINKSNYFILVTEDDFKKFDLPQPDSLKWLNKCF